MRGLLVAMIATLVLVLMMSCSEKKLPEKPELKVYDIQGKIAALGSDKRSVTLDHEDIPGLMRAMKMQFLIVDPRILEGLQVGDQVRGKLQVESGKYMITELKKQ
jgi:Cu/Ag efflux protein CusF